MKKWLVKNTGTKASPGHSEPRTTLMSPNEHARHADMLDEAYTGTPKPQQNGAEKDRAHQRHVTFVTTQPQPAAGHASITGPRPSGEKTVRSPAGRGDRGFDNKAIFFAAQGHEKQEVEDGLQNRPPHQHQELQPRSPKYQKEVSNNQDPVEKDGRLALNKNAIIPISSGSKQIEMGGHLLQPTSRVQYQKDGPEAAGPQGSSTGQSSQEDTVIHELVPTSSIVSFGDGDEVLPHHHKFGYYSGSQELGRGAYGVVYKVECQECHRVYALKVISLIPKYFGIHRVKQERMTQSELRSYQTLDHPHILKYVHHAIMERRYHIFTEFCQLGDLENFLKPEEPPQDLTAPEFMTGRFIDPDKASQISPWNLLEALASALARCHDGLLCSTRGGLVENYVGFATEWRQILHRDIKPGNVLLQHRELKYIDLDAIDSVCQEYEQIQIVPKLGDFGVCFQVDRDGETPSTAAVGTRIYWAPEIDSQAKTDDGKITSWSAKSDIWAAGAVLHRLLTGRLLAKPQPLALKDRMAVLSKGVVPGVQTDPRLVQAVCECLDQDPEGRPSALELLSLSLKSNNSPLTLQRSESFWRVISRAEHTERAKTVIKHFVSTYLPLLAKARTEFSPVEIVIIMGLTYEHATYEALTVIAGDLCAGFIGELEGGSVFHTIACLDDDVLIHDVFERWKWPSARSLSHLSTRPTKQGLLPSTVAALAGKRDLCVMLSRLEEASRTTANENILNRVAMNARRDAQNHARGELEYMFNILAKYSGGVRIPAMKMSEIFIESAEKGYSDVVRKLVQLGINPGTLGEYQQTALHLFAYAGNTEMVRYFLDCGINVDVRDETGRTPLHWAAWNGKAEVAKALLACGASIDAADRHGRTPLYGAAGGGFVDVVKQLMREGADISLGRGTDGETPMNNAKKNGHHVVATLLKEAVVE